MRNSFFSIITWVTTVILCTTSCNDDYLETAPTDQVSTVTVFETVDNAWAALNGIHRILYSQIFGSQPLGGQSGNMMMMDVMGEDVVLASSSSSWLRGNYQWVDHRNPSHYTVRYNYLFYYVIIGNANMIIANVDAAEGSEVDKAFIKGQALAYRAWSYFQLVQLFGEAYMEGAANDGLAVSIVTEPSTSPLPRNTVAEVYAQINTDFVDALTLLDGYERGTDKSQLNENVVKGMMARVALTQQNYGDAATYAQEAREGFPLMSESDYLSGFNDYTVGEWMWSSRIVADQTSYFYSFFAHMSLNYSSSLIRGTPRLIFSGLYDQISDTDVRKQLWDPTGENEVDFPLPASTFRRFKYHSRKFKVANESMSIGDVPYMRAAEMYLIEAEALARDGDGRAADVLYEYVIKRDPAYTRSTSTGTALVDEIMVQRRSELWGEGFRFYDLKRTKTPLTRRGGNHDATLAIKIEESVGTLNWQWLIPQDEINNSNGVIVQNPQTN
ncbi:RagB/SusD family nutrient uptake outer membrane protein [Sphingobacterium gobiense]|uniref:RagB/SusD family nutrient uptake outer membrane protein n=1 Tax=Sphingobacterium gobiense TaxID=1382456 RepID=A0A2S9JLS8_9SPHI|nr:RagB/SusD family nutrient uptake outer membrane protein [Sphingobacterium gobiense]PRD54100.1 RagB/SusD family nutrient uptake outer membrane protein [Sphingobacterium gobiense]